MKNPLSFKKEGEFDVASAQKTVDLCNLYTRVFSGPDGDRVLQDLMEKNFVMGPSTLVANDPISSAANEGRREVILRIMALLQMDAAQLQERILKHAKKV